MDLTIAIMVNVPTHDLSYDKAKEAARHRDGDVLAVYNTSDLADLVGSQYKFRDVINSPRMAYIHIRGVPDDVDLKTWLIRPIKDDVDRDIRLRNNRWRIPTSVMPAAMTNALRDDHEFTIVWGQVKAFIRKKVIADKLDASKDSETVELTDQDMRR